MPSSQYHPEACPGLRDTEFLFDRYKKWLDKGGGSAPNEASDAGFRDVERALSLRPRSELQAT